MKPKNKNGKQGQKGIVERKYNTNKQSRKTKVRRRDLHIKMGIRNQRKRQKLQYTKKGLMRKQLESVRNKT